MLAFLSQPRYTSDNHCGSGGERSKEMKKLARFLEILGCFLALAGLLVGCGIPSTADTRFHPTIIKYGFPEYPIYSESPCVDSGPKGTHFPSDDESVFVGQEIGKQSIAENIGGGFEQCATTIYQYAAILIFSFAQDTAHDTHALLKFTLLDDGAHHSAPERVSCATDLEIATQDMQENPDPSASEYYISLPSGVMSRLQSSQNVQIDARKAQWSLDVTDVVRAWLNRQRPNYGFVLSGEKGSEQPCLSTYGEWDLVLS